MAWLWEPGMRASPRWWWCAATATARYRAGGDRLTLAACGRQQAEVLSWGVEDEGGGGWWQACTC